MVSRALLRRGASTCGTTVKKYVDVPSAMRNHRGAPAGSGGQTRVATGDVNGDGKADAAINNSHSNIKNSKDAATGQTSGKRQHADNSINKESDAAPKQ